jgi:hypothetical protein
MAVGERPQMSLYAGKPASAPQPAKPKGKLRQKVQKIRQTLGGTAQHDASKIAGAIAGGHANFAPAREARAAGEARKTQVGSYFSPGGGHGFKFDPSNSSPGIRRPHFDAGASEHFDWFKPSAPSGGGEVGGPSVGRHAGGYDQAKDVRQVALSGSLAYGKHASADDRAGGYQGKRRKAE